MQVARRFDALGRGDAPLVLVDVGFHLDLAHGEDLVDVIVTRLDLERHARFVQVATHGLDRVRGPCQQCTLAKFLRALRESRGILFKLPRGAHLRVLRVVGESLDALAAALRALLVALGALAAALRLLDVLVRSAPLLPALEAAARQKLARVMLPVARPCLGAASVGLEEVPARPLRDGRRRGRGRDGRDGGRRGGDLGARVARDHRRAPDQEGQVPVEDLAAHRRRDAVLHVILHPLVLEQLAVLHGQADDPVERRPHMRDVRHRDVDLIDEVDIRFPGEQLALRLHRVLGDCGTANICDNRFAFIIGSVPHGAEHEEHQFHARILAVSCRGAQRSAPLRVPEAVLGGAADGGLEQPAKARLERDDRVRDRDVDAVEAAHRRVDLEVVLVRLERLALYPAPYHTARVAARVDDRDVEPDLPEPLCAGAQALAPDLELSHVGKLVERLDLDSLGQGHRGRDRRVDAVLGSRLGLVRVVVVVHAMAELRLDRGVLRVLGRRGATRTRAPGRVERSLLLELVGVARVVLTPPRAGGLGRVQPVVRRLDGVAAPALPLRYSARYDPLGRRCPALLLEHARQHRRLRALLLELRLQHLDLPRVVPSPAPAVRAAGRDEPSAGVSRAVVAAARVLARLALARSLLLLAGIAREHPCLGLLGAGALIVCA